MLFRLLLVAEHNELQKWLLIILYWFVCFAFQIFFSSRNFAKLDCVLVPDARRKTTTKFHYNLISICISNVIRVSIWQMKIKQKENCQINRIFMLMTNISVLLMLLTGLRFRLAVLGDKEASTSVPIACSLSAAMINSIFSLLRSQNMRNHQRAENAFRPLIRNR